MMTIYNVDEIFEEIPGDTDNILMKFPEEIINQLEWKPGDTLTIKVENEGLIIQKHE